MSKVDIENENLVCSYYLRNIDKILSVSEDIFQTPICNGIIFGAKKLKSEGLQFSLDTVYSFAKSKYTFDFTILQDIYENFIDYSNITYHQEKLESDYNKNVIIKGLLQDLLSQAHGPSMVSTSKAVDVLENVQRQIMLHTSPKVLLTTDELADIHEEILQQRLDGNRKKSIGFKVIDDKLPRSGAPGEMTLIAALRGSGKTTLKQNIQNNLLVKGICVVEFSLEMSQESNIDRFISMKGSVSLPELNAQKMTQEMYDIAKLQLEELRTFKNFLSTDEPSLNFKKLDSLLYRARDHFRSIGVLPNDEYFVYSIDLLDQMEEFDEGDGGPRQIKKAVNEWHRINKKHGAHGIGILQINENKLRGRTFRNPDEVDTYVPNIEDIYGGSAYAQRARTVIIAHRPLYMKKRIFPESAEEFEHELDILNLHVVKHNDGELFYQKFLFQGDRMRIIPIRYEKE